jgi:hypothetical protein
MVEIAHTSLVERIARVLAGEVHSSNAHGSNSSAAVEVDVAWPDYTDQAVAVLHAIREPDQAAAAAGDAETWHRMIEASIANTE